jgi:hypothetical protein
MAARQVASFGEIKVKLGEGVWVHRCLTIHLLASNSGLPVREELISLTG